MIKSIQAERLTGAYVQKGMEVVENGRYGVCILAGGQGTRLEFNGPKGCCPVNIGDKLQEIFKFHIEQLKGTNVPIFIMCSRENIYETEDYLTVHEEELKDMGYSREMITTFEQEELPLLRYNGEKLKIDGKIKKGSSGHGGVYKAIMKPEVREKIEDLNLKYIYITNVDNILEKPLDYDFIGLVASNGLELAVKSVEKTEPEEKVGLFIERNNRLEVLEYNEVGEELTERRDSDGTLYLKEANIMTQIISVDFLKKVSKIELPMHNAYKRKWGQEYIKRETLLFDAFKYAEKYKVIRVKREEEFAPIKNKEGKDSLDSAALLYLRYIRMQEAKAKKERKNLEYNI